MRFLLGLLAVPFILAHEAWHEYKRARYWRRHAKR